MSESFGHGTTKLFMQETVMLPRFLRSFFEWWNAFYPFWFSLTVLAAIIILLIVWFSNLEGGIHYVVTPRVPIAMRRVKNPFTISLDRNTACFPGVRCTISTNKFCYILPFWGVPADEFCELMKMNWSSMKISLLENVDNTFKNKCVASDPITRLYAGEQKSLVFVPPPSVYFDRRMGQDIFLSLVVFTLFMEDSIENDEEPFIFAQAVIIKVPAITISVQARSDDRQPNFSANVSRVPEILGIYVRESNSQTTGVVQRIYDGSLFSENVNGVEIPVCVACCQRTVNTVIFPCLHASLCSLCYHQCDTCPSCRGPMYLYFTLGPLTEIPQE